MATKIASSMAAQTNSEPLENEALTAAAEALVAKLRSRGLQVDQQSQVARESIDEMIEAGILQLMAPKHFGGSEAGIETFFDVGSTLGTGDGSTAWLFGILACHHVILGHFPLETQEELYGKTSHALFPLTFSGKGGKAKRVEGGYRVSGDWAFATGIDFSDWVGSIALVEGEGSAAVNLLMPKDEVEVIDDWNVAGMRGTGSRRFVVKDLFVPERRSLLQNDLMAGRTPGREYFSDMPTLRVPLHSMLLVTLLGASFGLARRAIDEFVDLTKSRSGYGGIDHAARSSTQAKIADAMTRYDAFYNLVKSNCALIDGHARNQTKASVEERLRYRRDGTLAAATCLEIVDTMVQAAGARSQHRSSPFQLIQRDMHTAATHVLLDRDDANELYGKHILGQELGEVRT